ncbi:hypothetical protein [Candidatus Pyrohabitans sp.]
MKRRKPIKDMFLDIAEEWEKHWRESISFYDFLNEYVEIDDDLRTYVIKKRKRKPEEEL